MRCVAPVGRKANSERHRAVTPYLLNISPSVSPKQIPSHVPSVTDFCECTVGSAGNGLDLISAAEERSGAKRRRGEMNVLIERTGGMSLKYGSM